MTDLADALDRTGECELVRFRSRTSARTTNETHLALRGLWSPLWRRSLGRSIDGLLPAVDVLHVAGLATPPTQKIPLIISVDDLRPLRDETQTHLRITQLRRAVQRGATLVASSRSASHEVISVLGVARSRVVVVPPAVPNVDVTRDGTDLVVNITGVDDLFIELAPQLIDLRERTRIARRGTGQPRAAGQKIRSSGLAVTIRARRDARDALANARVVMHLSDGARFPSFAIAALSAGVPTLARAIEINRELLEGAAALFAERPRSS